MNPIFIMNNIRYAIVLLSWTVSPCIWSHSSLGVPSAGEMDRDDHDPLRAGAAQEQRREWSAVVTNGLSWDYDFWSPSLVLCLPVMDSQSRFPTGTTPVGGDTNCTDHNTSDVHGIGVCVNVGGRDSVGWYQNLGGVIELWYNFNMRRTWEELWKTWVVF